MPRPLFPQLLAGTLLCLATAWWAPLSPAQSSTEATLRVIEEIPAKEREVVLINAAGFNQQTWADFLVSTSESYMVDGKGNFVALKQPAVDRVPRSIDSARFSQYVSWAMEPAPGSNYTFISGRVTANTGVGILLLEDLDGMVRINPQTDPKYVAGDPFESWCTASSPLASATDEFDLGFNTAIRTYTPVSLRKPQLIELSNYLVKGGKIFGLAPAKEKSCPVCKGMRKYSPDKEIPSETVACPSCKATGRIMVRPLFMVYTGTP